MVSYSNSTTMNSIQPNTFPFPVFIINLYRSADFCTYISDHLNSFGITAYKRSNSTDGSKIDPSEMIASDVNKHMIHMRNVGSGYSMTHI